METSKVMDITHPSNVQPSASSRPIIVSNRPMIAEDPMINQAALSAIAAEKPAGAPENTSSPEVASAPEVARQGKTIVPTTPAQEKSAPATSNDAESSPEPVTITIDANAQDTAEEQVSVSQAPEKKTDAEPAAPPSKEPVKPKDTEAKSKLEVASFDTPPPKMSEPSSFTALSDNSQLDEGDESSKQKTVEDKRQEELEELIAAGTYHVPIGQVAKRRGRIVFAVIVVVVLLLVVFDLALDAGLFTLAGVPHTDFLR
jgi:hypothetical protein